MEYEEFRRRIVDLQGDWGLFKVDFLDKDGFKNFVDNLFTNLFDYAEICITGYFSETIREGLEQIAKIQDHRIRLICQELEPNKPREKKNLDVLKKLCKTGVQIRVNNRIHARFLVAYIPNLFPKTRGLLILGSFDFNTECIGRERHDAGVKTGHPDLIKSIELFEEIWSDTESRPLDEKYP